MLSIIWSALSRPPFFKGWIVSRFKEHRWPRLEASFEDDTGSSIPWFGRTQSRPPSSRLRKVFSEPSEQRIYSIIRMSQVPEIEVHLIKFLKKSCFFILLVYNS